MRELRVPPLFAAGEQVQLEAPAGMIDAGSPEENARREADGGGGPRAWGRSSSSAPPIPAPA
ncbi:hypothetical protein ACU4GR_17655 [Methylobacterium oryzae CBMB20]